MLYIIINYMISKFMGDLSAAQNNYSYLSFKVNILFENIKNLPDFVY